jgi:hypothetical protein
MSESPSPCSVAEPSSPKPAAPCADSVAANNLKHSWGWEHTALDGIDGARTWCGWGILAHNATKIAVLAEEREMKSTSAASAQDRSTTTKGASGRPPPPPKKIPA